MFFFPFEKKSIKKADKLKQNVAMIEFKNQKTFLCLKNVFGKVKELKNSEWKRKKKKLKTRK